MISAPQLINALHLFKSALPPGAYARWAFLVSQEELETLVDEFQSKPELGLSLDPQAADDIKAGKAGLNLNGTWILPNTGLPEPMRLNG